MQLPKLEGLGPFNQLKPTTFCACIKSEPEFSKSYVVIIFVIFNDLRCEVILFVLLILLEIDNLEKLETQVIRDEEKQFKNTTQYLLKITMHNQTQMT
jgi:hypothetical protein